MLELKKWRFTRGRNPPRKDSFMKALIEFKIDEESIDFINNIDYDELANNLDLVHTHLNKLTLEGDFYFSYTGLSFWIENDNSIILRLPKEYITGIDVK